MSVLPTVLTMYITISRISREYSVRFAHATMKLIQVFGHTTFHVINIGKIILVIHSDITSGFFNVPSRIFFGKSQERIQHFIINRELKKSELPTPNLFF